MAGIANSGRRESKVFAGVVGGIELEIGGVDDAVVGDVQKRGVGAQGPVVFEAFPEDAADEGAVLIGADFGLDDGSHDNVVIERFFAAFESSFHFGGDFSLEIIEHAADQSFDLEISGVDKIGVGEKIAFEADGVGEERNIVEVAVASAGGEFTRFD